MISPTSNKLLQAMISKNSNIKYTLGILPSGAGGTRATLKEMAKIVRKFRHHPTIREKALSLTRGLRQKNYTGEAKRIHEFVRDGIRYVKDVRGVETLQWPIHTLEYFKQGDCDDKSMLVSSLLESVGHKTRFVAVGLRAGTFQHVFVQTKIGNRWWNVETTEPWPFGKGPGKMPSVMIEHV